MHYVYCCRCGNQVAPGAGGTRALPRPLPGMWRVRVYRYHPGLTIDPGLPTPSTARIPLCRLGTGKCGVKKPGFYPGQTYTHAYERD
jgi:hypothetical protein